MEREQLLKITDGDVVCYLAEKIDEDGFILYRLTWIDLIGNSHELFSYVYSDLLDFLKFKLQN